MRIDYVESESWESLINRTFRLSKALNKNVIIPFHGVDINVHHTMNPQDVFNTFHKVFDEYEVEVID